MVFYPVTGTEGPLVDMFDSSWKVRNIWDGVSFTQLDPDLPPPEVTRKPMRRLGQGRGYYRRPGPVRTMMKQRRLSSVN
uniref:Uncharacterized protein n=1 Tax=Cynoglossus semilaevis TaxID=244447 RepID=A0A3P8VL89_CYNSE